MSEKITTIKCPACCASLSVESSKKQVVCEYCGTTIFLNNENEKINRNIDEAEIKKAETDKLIKLKEMEMEEKKQAFAKKMMLFKIIVSVVLGGAGIAMLVIGATTEGKGGLLMGGIWAIMILGFVWLIPATHSNKKSLDDKKEEPNDKIELPDLVFDYEKKSYKVIRESFTDAGFSNIKCVPLNDLTTGILKKPNWVESITINGDDIDCGEEEYSPDAKIIIYYHSFSD